MRQPDSHPKPARTGLIAVTLLSMILTVACSGQDSSSTTGPDTASGSDVGSDVGVDGTTGPRTGEAALTHQFEPYTLAAGEEVVPCVQWTLNNDEPIYVNKVTLANQGFFHHSNWFVVPEDYAPGEDGYFNCDDRSFSEFEAATRGNVLFAQSTQALEEQQTLPDGVTIKIPANSKVMADVHFLNVSPRQVDTTARMTLDIIHPAQVDTVVAPFRLTYYDLQLPPKSTSRFSTECDFRTVYENTSDKSFDDFKLYYVLPHYHEKGSYFGLEYYGGERDGEQIFELSGFNAEANGQSFNPPIEMSGADGFRFTCGYDNPTDRTVGWGLGGSEMCVMLGFADSEMVLDAAVRGGTSKDRTEDGIQYFSSSSCGVIPFQGSSAIEPPTQKERTSDFYVPESADADELPPVPDCEEPDLEATPLQEPTLGNIQQQIFGVSCTYSYCHDTQGPTGNLNLTDDGDLHKRLMNHEMVTPTEMPLVDPGNPTNSWLYNVISTCQPSADGIDVSHMPRNSPTLLKDELIAMVRAWIANGAPDN
jgi:hypothetical protein